MLQTFPNPITHNLLLDLIRTPSQYIANTYSPQFSRPRSFSPLQPPYPPYHDPNAFCEYHSAGHTVDTCNQLKRRLQWMIHEGQLTFTKQNIQNNPLPDHQSSGNTGVNMLEYGAFQMIQEVP